ncbi:MAG: hypothetical protein ACREID_08760, partial [Planctomycetota bacterium]
MDKIRALAAVALLSAAALAQEPRDFAARFPVRTLAYFEADCAALRRGIEQLDVVRLLDDPKLRGFLGPLLMRIGAAGEKPSVALLERLQLGSWLSGRAAFGVAGFTRELSTAAGMPVTVPVEFREFLPIALSGRPWWNEGYRVRLLAAVEPGPVLRATVAGFLANPPPWLSREEVEIAGRSVVHVTFPEGGAVPLREVFADLSGDVWLLSTSREVFSAA